MGVTVEMLVCVLASHSKQSSKVPPQQLVGAMSRVSQALSPRYTPTADGSGRYTPAVGACDEAVAQGYVSHDQVRLSFYQFLMLLIFSCYSFYCVLRAVCSIFLACPG
jgi:hypothetical protein